MKSQFPLVKAKQDKASQDNTRTQKRIPMDLPAPKYTYQRGSKYTKEDSALYRKGFVSGMNTVSRSEMDEGLFDKKKKWTKGYKWRGFSEPFNEGFREGKDVALENPIKPVVKKKGK